MGLLCWSSVTTERLLQQAWVQSLFGELRAHMPLLGQKRKKYSDLFASLIMKDDVTDIIVQIFICTQKTGFQLRLYFGLRHQPVVED